MIKERITTESGSVYIIDHINKTWEREPGENAGQLRSASGDFLSIDTSQGYISMVCPSINPPYPRYITSTTIVTRELL